MHKGNQNTPFLMLPVTLIPKIDIYTIKEVRDHCAAEFAGKMRVTDKGVLDEIIYPWYKDFDRLTPRIFNRVNDLADENGILYDDDYNGFGNRDREFDPIDDRKELGLVINTQDMEMFRGYATIWKTACLIGLGEPGLNGRRQITDIAEAFKKSWLPKNNEPTALIRFDVFNSAVNRELTIDGFKLYAAIRSIEGNKPFVWAGKKFLNNRLLGNSKNNPTAVFSRRFIDNNLVYLAEKNLLTFIPRSNTILLSTTATPEILKDLTNNKLTKQPPKKSGWQ